MHIYIYIYIYIHTYHACGSPRGAGGEARAVVGGHEGGGGPSSIISMVINSVVSSISIVTSINIIIK